MKKKTYTTILVSFLIFFLSSFIKVNQEPVKKAELKSQDTLKKENKSILIDSISLTNIKLKPYKKNAHASYYADRFHGKRTASGQLFNMNGLTAAHKKLPFGTKVRVTNEKNGKSVIVLVNDRGPFVKGREIDLSKKAFFTIASSSKGYINVTIEILEK